MLFMNVLYNCVPLLYNYIQLTFKVDSQLCVMYNRSNLLMGGAGLMEFLFFRFVNLLWNLCPIVKAEIH